jgi:hypothetical protein
MKTVYLAGDLTDRTNAKGVDWREHVKNLLKCPTIDTIAGDYRGKEREEFVAIVKRDKSNIGACDILLGNYREPSVKTSMEILYAWERGLIVVLVASSSHELSSWLLYHHHKLCFSLEDAASYINSRLLGESHSQEPNESFIDAGKMIWHRN